MSSLWDPRFRGIIERNESIPGCQSPWARFPMLASLDQNTGGPNGGMVLFNSRAELRRRSALHQLSTWWNLPVAPRNFPWEQESLVSFMFGSGAVGVLGHGRYTNSMSGGDDELRLNTDPANPLAHVGADRWLLHVVHFANTRFGNLSRARNFQSLGRAILADDDEFVRH